MSDRSDVLAGPARAGTRGTGWRAPAAAALTAVAVAAAATAALPATATGGGSRPDARWTAAWGATPVPGTLPS